MKLTRILPVALALAAFSVAVAGDAPKSTDKKDCCAKCCDKACKDKKESKSAEPKK